MRRNVTSRGGKHCAALHRPALLLLACAALPLAGCAFGSRYVSLSYPPEDEQPAAETARAAGSRSGDVLLVVQDAREDTDRIGVVRNGYGIVTSSILTEDNVTIWAHDAIRTELERLGYNVVAEVGRESDLAAYERLDALLTQLWCDIFLFYDGQVTLRATLHPVQGPPLTGEFPTKVNSGLSWAASGEGTGKSLAQAMQASARAMLAELGFASRASAPAKTSIVTPEPARQE